MSMGEVDISWQALRRIVQDFCGTATELTEFVPLHGGQINTTLELHLSDARKIVIKVSPHRVDKSYEREAYQLTMLKNCGVPVPDVLCWKTGSLDDPFSYILLDFIEGVDLGEAKKQCAPETFDSLQAELAEIVAAMHDHTNAKYMRVMADGATFDTWPAFYRSVYDAIWHEAEKDKHLPKGMKRHISRIHERLERFLAHGDQPRLVHWDIWNTNVMAAPPSNGDGRWHIKALLDPNCKFAHAEAEIAYMDLFHTCTPAFLKTYQQHHKLDSDYHKFRKPIYQLYPMINHLNLFGESYLKPLTAAVEKTAHLV
jgi:fructosamine-3-kinase